MNREMEIVDVMTANRDKRVWAVAKGGDLEVTDDNVLSREKILDLIAFVFAKGDKKHMLFEDHQHHH